MMVDMSDPDSAQQIVTDIYESSGEPWRWTGQRPTVRILVPATDNLRLSVDFTIWSEGFKQTGPLDLTFFVNGHELQKFRYTTPGNKHFEKPVPADWLDSVEESTISVAVDKLYVSPADGAKFGVILSRIGFVK